MTDAIKTVLKPSSVDTVFLSHPILIKFAVKIHGSSRSFISDIFYTNIALAFWLWPNSASTITSRLLFLLLYLKASCKCRTILRIESREKMNINPLKTSSFTTAQMTFWLVNQDLIFHVNQQTIHMKWQALFSLENKKKMRMSSPAYLHIYFALSGLIKLWDKTTFSENTLRNRSIP